MKKDVTQPLGHKPIVKLESDKYICNMAKSIEEAKQ